MALSSTDCFETSVREDIQILQFPMMHFSNIFRSELSATQNQNWIPAKLYQECLTKSLDYNSFSDTIYSVYDTNVSAIPQKIVLIILRIFYCLNYGNMLDWRYVSIHEIVDLNAADLRLGVVIWILEFENITKVKSNDRMLRAHVLLHS